MRDGSKGDIEIQSYILSSSCHFRLLGESHACIWISRTGMRREQELKEHHEHPSPLNYESANDHFNPGLQWGLPNCRSDHFAADTLLQVHGGAGVGLHLHQAWSVHPHLRSVGVDRWGRGLGTYRVGNYGVDRRRAVVDAAFRVGRRNLGDGGYGRSYRQPLNLSGHRGTGG